jgi:hypothetical protein
VTQTVVLDENDLPLFIFAAVNGLGEPMSTADGWLPVIPVGSLISVKGVKRRITRYAMALDGNAQLLIRTEPW